MTHHIKSPFSIVWAIIWTYLSLTFLVSIVQVDANRRIHRLKIFRNNYYSHLFHDRIVRLALFPWELWRNQLQAHSERSFFQATITSNDIVIQILILNDLLFDHCNSDEAHVVSASYRFYQNESSWIHFSWNELILYRRQIWDWDICQQRRKEYELKKWLRRWVKTIKAESTSRK